jgi:5-methylcytosine-specific restriction endonuclease McrA
MQQWLTSQLRRISMRWPPKHETLTRAKVWLQVGKFKNGNAKMGIFYSCAECERLELPNTLHPKDNVQVDHIIEIAGNGFTTWDNYITNLFCEADKLQVLCKPCHLIKTKKYLDTVNKT